MLVFVASGSSTVPAAAQAHGAYCRTFCAAAALAVAFYALDFYCLAELELDRDRAISRAVVM